MARPKAGNELNRSLRVDIRVSKAELTEIDRLAERLGATRTHAILTAISAYSALLGDAEKPEGKR